MENNAKRRQKVWKRKFAQIAARDRQFTVRNNTIPKTFTFANYVKVFTDWDKRTQFGKFEINTYGHLFGIDKDGNYHLIERKFDPAPMLLKHKQPLTEWVEIKDDKPTRVKSTSLHKDPIKMNRVQYMEKLVEHKLAKWERKHPKPMDMFKEEVEKWTQTRENEKMRIRDFVVSIYDPLLLIGRFVLNKSDTATYQEEEVAKIKDINGEGHKVNELKDDSKLLQKAKKITNEVKAKRKNLVATNLRDHKRQRGRIILPQAA